jgi:hypothetical protein
LRAAGALVACLMVVAFVAHPVTVDADDISIPTGSVWEYSYNETASDPGSHYLSLNGTLTRECLGLTTLNLSGEGPEAVLFYSTTMAYLDGRLAVYNYIFGTYSWQDVSGTLETTELEYFDPYTGMPVRSVVNYELEIVQWGTVQPLVYYEEHNDTCYSSVSIQPFDLRLEEGFGNLTPLTNWTVVYSGTASVEGFEDDQDFSRSIDIHAHVNQTYIGNETVAVPAGSLACRKVTSDYADSSVVEWYSPVAKGNAKVTISYKSEVDDTVLSLVDYDLREETISEPHGLDVIVLLAIVVAVSVTVAATLAFYLHRQQGRPPAEQDQNVPSDERKDD